MASLDYLSHEEFTRERNNWPSGNTLLARIAYFSSVPTETGCIEWTGAFSKNGRPFLTIDGKGRKALVSRLVWIWNKGCIPAGMIIRHVACRNKKCINIDHLDIGTHFDNAKDRDRDGMTHHGHNHYAAILTEDQVRDILLHHESHRAAAARYGVGKSTIVNIRNGKNWAHLSRPN